MKFKNKATKEIRKAEMRDDGIYLYSETAEEWRKCDWEVLAKYWEEYKEEPKVGYMIDPMEEDCVATEDSGYEEPDIERAKELGIWLGTKEEAELAVRKLKAFKRLKDKGFEIEKWEWRFGVGKAWIAMKGSCPDEEMREDLTILFGEKE